MSDTVNMDAETFLQYVRLRSASCLDLSHGEADGLLRLLDERTRERDEARRELEEARISKTNAVLNLERTKARLAAVEAEAKMLRAQLVVHFHEPDCTGNAETCPVGECSMCAVRDCPSAEPLHYHHDGCPVCSFDAAHAGKDTAKSGEEK